MKHCEHCNKNYSDAQNFCTECGQTLASIPDSQYREALNDSSKHNVKTRRPVWKIIVITLAVLAVGFFALLNYLMNAATYLRLEPNQLIGSKKGGEVVVDIDYDGYIWVINHIPDWVEVEEYEQSFNVIAEPNLTGYKREGSITVQSGDLIAQVMIQQSNLASYIHISENSIHFAKAGGTKTISIDTDGCDYTVEYPDFLSITTDDDDIRIKAHTNSDEYRTGYVTLKEDNVRTRIYITQGGTCNNCHGAGYISCAQCMGQGGWGYGMYYSQCWFCGGSGKIQCSSCDGTGERE